MPIGRWPNMLLFSREVVSDLLNLDVGNRSNFSKIYRKFISYIYVFVEYFAVKKYLRAMFR